MQTESGTISLVWSGGISLAIAEESYRLTRGDIHTLLFYGHRVPLVRTEETVHPDGAIVAETIVDGFIAVHPSGRAVIAEIRGGSYGIPFACFQQVARGEVVSAPLFSVAPEYAGGFR